MKHLFLTALAGIFIAMPTMAQEDDWRYTDDWLTDGNYEHAKNVHASPAPKSISETLKYLPSLPTIDQICSKYAKYIADSTVYRPYRKSVEQTLLIARTEQDAIQQRINKVDAKQKKQGQQAMQQYQSNVNAGLMPSQEEMMQLYMSGVITDNMSEEQMMDVMAGQFAQKWGISKQEYLKIMGMAQSNPKQTETYIKTNHPDLYKRLYAANAGYNTQEIPDDPRDARFGEISEELSELQEKLNNCIDKIYGTHVSAAGELVVSDLDLLNVTLHTEWSKSAEAKQIDAIEYALQKRVEAWISTLKTDAETVPYPAWWTEERKKENALIDQWNHQTAERWLQIVSSRESKIKSIFERIAELENQAEQLSRQGDTENMMYLQTKLRFNTFYSYLVWLSGPIDDALGFPCIEHVETSGSAILGKG